MATKPTLRMPCACAVLTTSEITRYLVVSSPRMFTAIPAVLAYNFFVRLNRVTYNQFDTFAHDLHDFFATGARVGELPTKR